ncbi:chemotaxis protein CheA [Virgibacillus sp. MSJ-26]|uniref:chemotaxis protein CheW n=1 Tax=Virgibacillus sp. MSJ-26 TaxID=2841522 RepID=UPI001C1160B6|nr:chemotaxis protein CheA [Virgibacillus sp. MSJ-26]
METNPYLELFLDESNEHLQAVNDNLLKLEEEPTNLDIVNEIFRSAHTLKGMAATMEYSDIATLTHHMENVLDDIRNQELNVTTDVIDISFDAVELLEEMVKSIAEGGAGERDISSLVARLDQIGSSENIETMKTVDKPDVHLELDEYQLTVIKQGNEQGYNSYQITIELIEDCMLKAARVFMIFEVLEGLGEIIQTDPSVEELEAENFEQSFSLIVLSKESAKKIDTDVNRISEINQVIISSFDVTDSVKEKPESKSSQEIHQAGDESESNQSKSVPSKTIRVNMERIDGLMNLFEEIVISRGRLEQLSSELENHELTETVEEISRASSEMQNLILSMRMVPVEQVFNRFPRMVRGLAKDLDKKVKLEIIGAETELDRTVIDEIGDPLVHLIRNSVDHGIESPEERLNSGKPGEGMLILRAYHSGNHVFIEVEDDGAGINRDKVLHKAIENGLVDSEQSEHMSDHEIHQLILSSGFSTADHISDVSGRGVGLDVVRSKIESLGGKILIHSAEGEGSKFIIELPLTLSILSTLMVNVADEIYGVPLSSIVETAILTKEQIMHARGRYVMDFRGKVVPLVFLKEVFQVPCDLSDVQENYFSIVIVQKGDKLTGLVVNSFIGQHEVVLKSLGNYLQDVYAISGATILGNGHVALIIDPNELIK